MKKDIYGEIIKDFNKLNEVHEKFEEYNRHGFELFNDSSESFILQEEFYKSEVNLIEGVLTANFKNLYTYSLKNNFYYFDCPFKIYTNHFEERKEQFFKINIDATEEEFLIDEVEYFASPSDNRLIGENLIYNYNKYFLESKNYKFSFKRKLDFISGKLEPFGFRVEMSEPEAYYDERFNSDLYMDCFPKVVPIIVEEDSVSTIITQTSNNLSATNKRLKTDLSVPQLSLLFKMINDLKPKIFDTVSDAELHRFISANFQTKQSNPQKGISEKKLRILFNQPDYKAIEFWEKHLHTMLSELRKLK